MINKLRNGDVTVVADIKAKLLESVKFDYVMNEATKYVIGLKDGSVLTKDFKFTKNLNLAYTFKSEKEAIEYEDNHGNDIEGLTYVYKIDNNKLIMEKGKMITIEVDGERAEVDKSDLKDLEDLAKKEKKTFKVINKVD